MPHRVLQLHMHSRLAKWRSHNLWYQTDRTCVHAWLWKDSAALDRRHSCKRRSAPLLTPVPVVIGDLLATPLS